jgi:hypothetical protein
MLNMQHNTAASTKTPDRTTLWRIAVLAVIAAASLAMPVTSMAQTAQSGEAKQAAALSLKKQLTNHKAIYNTIRTPSTMTPTANDGLNHGEFAPLFPTDYYNTNGG